MLNRSAVLGRVVVAVSVVTIGESALVALGRGTRADTKTSNTIKIGHYGSLTGSEATLGRAPIAAFASRSRRSTPRAGSMASRWS